MTKKGNGLDGGLIHIYTGDGKGKTTAAVGLAVRARSMGLRTLFAQFFKKKKKSGGEAILLREIGVKTMIFDKVKSPYFNPTIDKKVLKEEVEKAISHLEEIFTQEKFDIIILDEFICLITERLLTEERAIKFIKAKPDGVELVLTGRGASEKIMKYADYVTAMRKIKHPYERNIRARKGIEL